MSQKILSQIIDEVQDGGRPEYDDLRYAVVALSALHGFNMMALVKLASKEKEGKYRKDLFGLDWESRESFRRFQAALKMPPKVYVGESHDPDSEECQRWRKISKGILNKLESGSKDQQSPGA